MINGNNINLNKNNNINNVYLLLAKKSKVLEEENKQLKEEIKKFSDEKNVQTIDYYLRLRSDLLNEIEIMKQKNENNELNLKSENEKLKNQIEFIKNQLKQNINEKNELINQNEDLIKQKNLLTENPNINTTVSNNNNNERNIINVVNNNNNEVEKIKNNILEVDNKKNLLNQVKLSGIQSHMNTESNENFNDFFPQDNEQVIYNKIGNKENISDNNMNLKNINNNFNNIKDSINNMNENLKKEDLNNVNENENINNNNNNNYNNEINDNLNINNINNLNKPNENKSIGIQLIQSGDANKIEELEERISELTEENEHKDFTIKELNEKINEQKNEFQKIQKNLKEEIEIWKNKYNSIISNDKTVDDMYKIAYEKQYENFKKEVEKNNYEVQKKILFQQNYINKTSKETKELTDSYSKDIENKNNEISKLKDDLKNLQKNYDSMYKLYSYHIDGLSKNINKMKQLYVTREQEFVNITNYYIKMVAEYSKPINDFDNIKNKTESEYIKESQNNIQLLKENENLQKEITHLKNENINSKMNMRVKLSQTIKEYGDMLELILKNQNDINSKINSLIDFNVKTEENLNLFNSINEDNKILKEKNNTLETKIKMLESNSKDNEILLLREKVMNLENENEIKNSSIKQYEEMFRLIKTTKNITYDDILIKMREEIIRLNNQIASLNKTRDSIENFYKQEILKMMDLVKISKNKNEELKNIISKMENDFMGKKDTVLNLWILEFQEFKNNLVNLNDIKNIINHFHINGEELTKHKSYICNEELYIIRQEIKKKDDYFEKLDSSRKEENERNLKIVENYKKNMNDKIKTYEMLIDNKKKEIDAVKLEKEKLNNFDNKKKEQDEKEMKIWEEQKKHLDEILNEQIDAKGNDINLLKDQIKLYEDKIQKMNIEFNDKIVKIKESCDEQLKNVKERENFVIQQNENTLEQFEIYKDEKERMINALKVENESLKNKNSLMSKGV